MMLGFCPRSSTTWISAMVVLNCLTSTVSGLSTAPGSPCEDTCHQMSTNTTSAEMVCRDKLFSTTTKGSNFVECVECELGSSYVDTNTGQADVSWGIYNLRFALASCIFGYPKKVVNISSPCVVSCQDLEPALEYELKDPTSLNLGTYCSTSSFADNIVDQCKLCYNHTKAQTTQRQAYLANFVEAVRFNCHFQTPTGSSFAISPARIFSESLLPSTRPSTTASSGDGGVENLTLVIALPILGFVLVLCGTTLCCFFFIRWRRRRAREQRQSSYLHARWNDTTMSTPTHGWGPQYGPPPGPGPGSGFGFGFVDSDGTGHDVGYAKPGFVEVSEPGLPVAQTHGFGQAMGSPGLEKGNGYFR